MLERGDYAAARALYDECVPFFRETSDTRGLAQTLLSLGKAALREGSTEYAGRIYVEALVRWRELDINAGVVRCLALYFAHGQSDRPGGRRGSIFALFDPGNRGRVTWSVVEMAWQSPLCGACGPFPAIKSRMCEIQA
jgi:hypothetical protein